VVRNDRADVAVIGAGPAGRRAALECARRGRRVVVIERLATRDGGRPNAGTITSKTLRAAISEAIGLGPGGRAAGALGRRQMALARLAGPVNRLLEEEQEGARAELEAAGVRLVQGRARFTSEQSLAVTSDEPDGPEVIVRAGDLVVACGSQSVRPEDVDFDGRTVVDAAGVLDLGEAPVTLVVVGGGLVGLEYASMFAALGTHVTVVEQRSEVAPFLDEDLAAALLQTLGKRNVTLRLGEAATAVRRQADGTAMTYLADGSWLQSRAVIWAGTRRGAVDDLDLSVAGLQADERGCLVVDDDGRTAQPHIFGAGDVSGLPTLASVADRQGLRAAVAICGEPPPAGAEALVVGLWSIPELASVGMSSAQATRDGIEHVSGKGLFADTIRGRIDGRPDGFVKLVVDPVGRRVLGVHVFGTGATELVHLGSALLRFGATLDDALEMGYVYPTLSEAYRAAAREALDALGG
jgi:NAD(P) transhydrogenase